MCRALLYLGQPVLLDNLLYQPDSALVRQSYMPKMLHMLNLAGFGLRAWDPHSHAPDTPFSYGSSSLPVFDRNLKNLAETRRRRGDDRGRAGSMSGSVDTAPERRVVTAARSGA